MNKTDNVKIVASCRSLNEAKQFLKMCDSLGFQWKDGKRFSENECWELYKERTCYNIFEGTFGKIETYKEQGYNIVDSKHFFEQLFSLQFVKHKFKKFDKVLVRNTKTSKWQYGVFLSYNDKNFKYPYTTLLPHNQSWAECISFLGNENLCNTNKSSK